MARFAPDSSLISSYAHSVYRYKTGEIDDDGEFVYRPMSFQNDLEDITLTYGNFDILEFDPSVPEQAREAFRVKVTDLDENIAHDVQDEKLDLFQFMEHIANFIHVGSKTFAPLSSLPTKLSQLQNDAGYVKSTDPIQRASVADTADKLTNPVTIAITGGVTGTATAFDGSQNISINVSTVKADKDGSGNVIATTYAKKTELPDALTDQDITDGTDDTGKLISAKKLTTYVRNVASDIDTGVMSVTTGGTNGTLNVDGVNVAVKGLGSAAYTASTAYAEKSHTHGSNEVVSMNLYVKPNEFKGAILQNDTLNDAIGKLEKALDLKEPSLSIITASELSGGTITTERTVNAKVLSDWMLSKVPKSTGSNSKFVYTDANGTISAADFEIWITDN